MAFSPTDFRRSLAIPAIICLFLAMVPWSAQHATRAAGSSAMTILMTEEPDTLDPQKTSTAITAQILRYVGDPLLWLNPKGQYVPGLATSYTISPDGLTYSFTLRQGVTFQDGTKVDATAWVATFQRALNPATKSPIAASLLGNVAAIRATGAYSFMIKLKTPYASFLHNLTSPDLIALSPAALKSEGAAFGRHPVSTGPWMVAEWKTGDHITLTRNPHYHWGPSFVQAGPPRIQTLTFRLITDEATQTAAFLSGELDQLTLPTPSVQRIENMHKYTILKFLRQGVGLFMEFNVLKPPFNDVRVRQAMNYAIDKRAVLQIGINGLGEPAYGVLPPTIFGYWPGIATYRYSYNPKKALALLAQAGWVMKNGTLMKGGKPFTFTLYNTAIDSWKRSALVVQAQLKQIGIQMNIQNYEFATLLSRCAAGDQQADFLGYTYSDPDILYIWFDSKNIGTGLANSHDNDPHIDALIDQMRQTIDTTKRKAVIAELQRYIADQALWVPLWNNYNYLAFQPRVHGAFLDSEGNVILNNATLSS